MSYQVALETFNGPLDLLLYLVKKHELDILDIPIALITEQFNEHLRVLQMLQQLDVELAGEFLVTAATLMEIKSRFLLPHSPEVEAEQIDDPRRELVKQLLEYRRFKDAALLLEERAVEHARRFSRSAPPEPNMTPDTPLIRSVELWDLVSAFARLMREAAVNQPRSIVVDETPQQVHQENILAYLRAVGGECPFEALFQGVYERSRFIGLFLATLELIKLRQVIAEQSAFFGPIRVRLRETEPFSEIVGSPTESSIGSAGA